MKKWLNIFFFLAIIAYLIVALGFTTTRDEERVCSNLKINLLDSMDAGFFNKRDVEKILLAPGNEILGYPVKNINTRILEARLMDNPYIKKADLFFNVSGELRADITQRKPIVRIITRSQHTYYLDKEGYILPAHGNFAPFILIANGYFTEGQELQKPVSVFDLAENRSFREWKEVLKLAEYIKSDKFLNAQFVQIYYNGDGDFELIPRVGAHQIILGDVEDLAQKFRKLRVFYEEGLKYKGWNIYEKINLKYKNQIICTKR